jgi:hypothetical protein
MNRPATGVKSEGVNMTEGASELGLTPDLTTRDLWRSRRWAKEKGEMRHFFLFVPVGLQEFFYMP